MVGTFFSFTVRAACTTHSLHRPETSATTDGSSASVLMLRIDEVGSPLLSRICRRSRLSPSRPEAFSCSTRNCSAREYALSVGERCSRSTPITTSVGAVAESSSDVQPASAPASSATAARAAVTRRGDLTGCLLIEVPRIDDVRTGRRAHGQQVRPIARNLANVKVPRSSRVITRSETIISHSGWNLGGHG